MESNNLYTVDTKLQFEFPPQIFTCKNQIKIPIISIDYSLYKMRLYYFSSTFTLKLLLLKN